MTDEALGEKQEQGKLEGWMILEIFGHARFAGYVTVETVGVSAMVRLDVPPLEERDLVVERPRYDGAGDYIPAGTKVREKAVQGYTKYFGVGAIYSMTPCTKEACLAALEQIQPRPVQPLEMPARIMLAQGHAAGELTEDNPEYEEDGPEN